MREVERSVLEIFRARGSRHAGWIFEAEVVTAMEHDIYGFQRRGQFEVKLAHRAWY